MKNKKDKLQFFSGSNIERMEAEINQILYFLNTGRISYSQARTKLHYATKDCMTIYYDVCGKIATAQSTISTMRRYGKIDHERVLEASKRIMSEIELPSCGNRIRQALEQVVNASDSFADGTCVLRELSKSIQEARRIIKDDSNSLQRDLSDHLSKAKRLDRQKAAPARKAHIRLSEDPVLDKQMKDNASGYLGSDTILPSEQEIQAFANMEVRKIPKS